MALALVPLPQTHFPARLIMDAKEYTGAGLILRSALELGAVTLLVFCTGWVGVRIAEVVHRQSVTPSRDGVIQLRLVKSDRHGDVSFEEGSGYTGWWHCQGNDWSLAWRLEPASTRYSVEVRLATPVPPGGQKLEVAVGDHKLQAAVPDTGGSAKWKTLSLGEIALENKAYSLTVRGCTNLNVKSLALRPLVSAS
jgi:hypothetical protein